MVTNVELAKELSEQKDRNRVLKEALEEMKRKLEKVVEETKKNREGESSTSGKGKVDEEDLVPKFDPPITK